MLPNVLDTLSVPAEFWARVVGCSPTQFREWATGQRETPEFVVEELSKAIGVPAELLSCQRHVESNLDTVMPPLWLKARASGLGEDEHCAIVLARLLAARYDELLDLVRSPANTYRDLFNGIRAAVDPQQPARAQGSQAATAFLELTGLGSGARAIGEVFRGHLRAHGVLILETPINSRKLEGFCVPVGGTERVRPCLLANSYRTTWFRRNYILLHELAHAIFDLEAVSAVFDIDGVERDGPFAPTDPSNIQEQRADSFAVHALVPKGLLVALHGEKVFERPSSRGMAELVAATHAEQRVILKAAREYELISDSAADALAGLRITRDLAAISPHVRGLAALPSSETREPRVQAWGNRLTSFPVPDLRLPIPYVELVLRALADRKISRGKAAELLMVTEEELSSRYGAPSPRNDAA